MVQLQQPRRTTFLMWGSLLGGLGLGAFGYQGTKAQNIASAQQAQKQNIRMSVRQ